ncbi:hypothetical protein GJ744_004205 [Endocarpon pusillum]|uniref:Riboflavin kinase n=1 Tax=Endocarpon pusillum TaxID=364733 RepID=A0A8H7DYY7_9EURO|nr:hypothetical protein GJ744_004205 [Endocarpon pusillum]
MRPDGPRDPVAGPHSGPEAPFPIKLSGPVIKGFGRGSKELGIPTANIPPGALDQYPDLSTGIYYGLVGLLLPASPPDTSSTSLSPSPPPSAATSSPSIHPAVLSIGYNPFYANKSRSIEIHVLPQHNPSTAPTSLPSDFYGAPLNLLILGFIRPEYDYVSKESLIEDIHVDCEVARRSLEREAYRRFEGGEWGSGCWVGGEGRGERRRGRRDVGGEGEGGGAGSGCDISEVK